MPLAFQNVVSLEAIKITPNPNIESISPENRNCYFDYEYPLKSQQRYSYVSQDENMQVLEKCHITLPRPPVYLSVTSRKLCQILAPVQSACRGTFLPSTPTFGSARPLKPGTSPMRLTSCPMRFARYGNDFCNYDCDKSP